MGPLVTLLISVLGVFVFIVEANQKGPHRLLKPMDGVHLRVAVYHVCYILISIDNQRPFS